MRELAILGGTRGRGHDDAMRRFDGSALLATGFSNPKPFLAALHAYIGRLRDEQGARAG